MKRQFTVPITFVVENEEAKSRKAMKFSLEELKDVLEESVILDFDYEDGAIALGDNRLAGMEIDWDMLQES